MNDASHHGRQRRRLLNRRSIAAVSVIAVAALLGSCASGPAGENNSDEEKTSVKLILDWIPSGQYGAFYAAMNEGYYADAGLDVEIIPGSGTAAVVQALESGQADFGFTDWVATAQANSQGSSVRQIAAIYQKAPYIIASRTDGANVTKPEQLDGLTVGTSPGSFTPTVLRGYMALKGMSPDSIEFVDVDPSAKNSLLLQGQVESIETFYTSAAALAAAAEAEGIGISTLLLADNGLDLYANGLVALASTLQEKPELAKKFVAATLKGWAKVANDGKAGIDAVLKAQPEMDAVLATEEQKRVLSLVITSDTKANGIGTFSEDRVKATYDFIKDHTGLDNLPPIEELYSADFLPSEPVKP